MAKSPDKISLFSAVKSAAVVARAFQVAAKDKTSVMFWLKKQSLKFEAKIVQYFKDAGRIVIQLPSAVTSEQLIKAIAKQEHSREIFGSFQVDDTYFFFKTTFIREPEHSNLSLETPKNFYKLQRRENLRIPLSRQSAPKVTLFRPDQKYTQKAAEDPWNYISFRMLDISAGGMSLAVKLEDEFLFKNSAKVHDIYFRLRGAAIVVEGKVVHRAQVLSDKGKPIFRIGIQFSGLTVSHEKTIAQFVLGESRKLFSLLEPTD